MGNRTRIVIGFDIGDRTSVAFRLRVGTLVRINFRTVRCDARCVSLPLSLRCADHAGRARPLDGDQGPEQGFDRELQPLRGRLAPARAGSRRKEATVANRSKATYAWEGFGRPVEIDHETSGSTRIGGLERGS